MFHSDQIDSLAVNSGFEVAVLQENLNHALAALAPDMKQIRRDYANPIYGCVRLEAAASRLTIQTGTGVAIPVPGYVIREGAFVVPFEVLREYVALLPSERVDLKRTDAGLRLICGGTTAHLKGASAADFPMLAVGAGKPLLCIPVAELRRMIERVTPFALKKNADTKFGQLHFTARDGLFALEAADGYRAIRVRSAVPATGSFLLCVERASALLAVLKKTKGGTVEVSVAGDNVIFQTETERYCYGTTSGIAFPTFDRSLASDADQVYAEATGLLRQVKAFGKYKAVYLSPSGATAYSIETGDLSRELAVTWSYDEAFSVGINPAHLITALKSLNATMRLSINTETGTFHFADATTEIAVMGLGDRT